MANTKTRFIDSSLNKIYEEKTKKNKNEKPTGFLFSILENKAYHLMVMMKMTPDKIKSYQKTRILITVLMILPGLLVYVMLHKTWGLGLMVGFPVFMWFYYYYRVISSFKIYNFKRQIEYAKFARMCIPYLIQTDKQVSLFGIFDRMRDKVSPTIRFHLTKLMNEMSEDPGNEKPFENFAVEISGTQDSSLFMEQIFDYQQSSADISTIKQLSILQNEQLFENVDDIIKMKLARYYPISNIFTMLIFVLLLGCLLGFMWYQIQQIGVISSLSKVK